MNKVNLTKDQRFDYRAWACRIVAECIESDLGTGFDVADATPDRERAITAVKKVCKRLREEARKRENRDARIKRRAYERHEEAALSGGYGK